MGGIYECTVEMDSGAMLYMPSFVNTGSGIEKLVGVGYTDTQNGQLISLVLFFQNKESRLKIKVPTMIIAI
jgi:hypothetical protein